MNILGENIFATAATAAQLMEKAAAAAGLMKEDFIQVYLKVFSGEVGWLEGPLLHLDISSSGKPVQA